MKDLITSGVRESGRLDVGHVLREAETCARVPPCCRNHDTIRRTHVRMDCSIENIVEPTAEQVARTGLV